jgi:hypothetical protein
MWVVEPLGNSSLFNIRHLFTCIYGAFLRWPQVPSLECAVDEYAVLCQRGDMLSRLGCSKDPTVRPCLGTVERFESPPHPSGGVPQEAAELDIRSRERRHRLGAGARRSGPRRRTGAHLLTRRPWESRSRLRAFERRFGPSNSSHKNIRARKIFSWEFSERYGAA